MRPSLIELEGIVGEGGSIDGGFPTGNDIGVPAVLLADDNMKEGKGRIGDLGR